MRRLAFPTHALFWTLFTWGLGLALASLFIAGGPARRVKAAGPLAGLPAGFVDETVVSGLWSPRDFVFTPDGRILFAERGSDTSSDINFASIRVFKDGALLPQRAITFHVCGDGERGFLGLALDPNFPLNGYIYVYYTRQGTSTTCGYGTYSNGTDGPRNRISRVTMAGDMVISNSAATTHNPGTATIRMVSSHFPNRRLTSLARPLARRHADKTRIGRNDDHLF